MKDINNKIVLITGGASGIGKIMVRLLLERRAQVIIWDIDKKNLEKVNSSYIALGKLTTMVVDISSRSEIKKAALLVIGQFGGIDVLINNAGIVIGNYFHGHTEDEILRTMHINAIAPMLVTRAFLDTMLAKNTGHICNIASSGGLLSNPKMSVYVASKWSLIGFSDSLRLEMKRLNKDIKVTTVMPYYISTGMFRGVRSKIPILKPEAAALRILRAIEKNKRMVSVPGYIYRLTRLAQGILPISVFDWFTGKVLGIYRTMDQFTGRKG